jgi:hypothetical protein
MVTDLVFVLYLEGFLQRTPLLMSPCFQSLIQAQSALSRIKTSMSLPKTNRPGVACSVLW